MYPEFADAFSTNLEITFNLRDVSTLFMDKFLILSIIGISKLFCSTSSFFGVWKFSLWKKKPELKCTFSLEKIIC